MSIAYSKIPKLFIVFFLILFIFSFQANSQFWNPIGSNDLNWPGRGESGSISMKMDNNGQPTIAFTDYYHGRRTTVMSWNGYTWTKIGASGINKGRTVYNSLALDPQNNPIVAFSDADRSWQTHVMKWNGASWIDFPYYPSLGYNYYQSLALDSLGNPIVAFADSHFGYKVTVIRWNGSNWITLGNQSMTAKGTNVLKLATDKSGNIFMAFVDSTAGNKVSIVNWNGSNWNYVGSPGVSLGVSYCIDLAINSTGKPFVAYNDSTIGNKLVVLKWNGVKWIKLGNTTVSTLGVDHLSMALSKSGNPILAYGDGLNKSECYVSKWNGTSWVMIGTGKVSDISTDGNIYPSIAIDVDSINDPTLVYLSMNLNNKNIAFQWKGNKWNVLGEKGIEPRVGANYSLTFDKQNRLVIAYQDLSNNSKTTVIRRESNQWKIIGQPGFNPGYSSDQSLAIDTVGNPIVAFTDYSIGNSSLSVMKWNGTNWSYVGSSAIVSTNAKLETILIDKNNYPVIAYQDQSQPDSIKIIRWNGSTWNYITSPGRANGKKQYFAMTPQGDLIISFIDRNNSNKLKVVKWNGVNWVNIGPGYLNSATTSLFAMKLDSRGYPFVAYSEYSTSNLNVPINVKSWNGVAWDSTSFSLVKQSFFDIGLTTTLSDAPVVSLFAIDDSLFFKTPVYTLSGLSWNRIDEPEFLGAPYGPEGVSSLTTDKEGHIVQSEHSGFLYLKEYSPIKNYPFLDNLCTSDSNWISYETKGIFFNPGNVFTVQLSDSSGSFNAPSTLTSIASTSPVGMFSFVIPFGTIPGSGYHVRVNSSNPAIVGLSDQNNIRISNSAPQTPSSISGNKTTACPGSTQVYSCPSISLADNYFWTSPSGMQIIDGNGTNRITVQILPNFTKGSLSVFALNSCGNSNTKSVVIRGIPDTPSAISGITKNLCGISTSYSVSASTSSTISYTWNVPSFAAVISGQNTNSIQVNWPTTPFSNQSICVSTNNVCGSSASSCLNTMSSAPKWPSTINGPLTVCSGQSGINYSVAAEPGVNYTWSGPIGSTIVSGQGTSNILFNWGTTTGALKIVSSNQCSSTVRSLNILVNCRIGFDNVDMNLLTIHPNPGQSKISIQYIADVEDNCVLKIIDITGKVILVNNTNCISGSNEFSLDITSLSSGIYMLQLITSQQQLTNKLVIQ